MPDLHPLLNRQHGVVSRRQAVRFLTVRMIERRITSGRWQVAHRGVYVTHSGPLDRPQQRWVAVLGAGSGLLAGLSALETLGLHGFDRDQTDILLPARIHPQTPPRGVLVHRTTRLPSADLHRQGDPPGTAPARSLIDAAQWATSDRSARTIIAAGLQQRLVRPDHLRSALTRMRRAHRRALIIDLIADAELGAHTPTEADFLHLCRRHSFPEPALSHPRTDSTGRQRYLDAYFLDFGLHIEIDGAHHTDVRHWWADMQRQNELWIAGDRVLRFPSWVINARSDEVARQVRAALIAAGWHPPTP